MNHTNQKTTFKVMFAYFAVLLALLPFIVTFSAFLTDIFEKIGAYMWLQNQIVPYEARYVAVLLKLFRINGLVTPGAGYALVVEFKGSNFVPVDIQWNCIGWQSLVLLLLTLVPGLRGKWKKVSKLEVVALGLLGIFLINIFRMAIVISLAYYVDNIAAMIVHDYFAALVSLLWLIFFWWFSYSYILESSKVGVKELPFD